MKDDKIRYAVIFERDMEVLEANHVTPGAAWNVKLFDYTNSDQITIVKTKNDVILGEVNRKGQLLNTQKDFPQTIWN
jgi:hypothetical protein